MDTVPHPASNGNIPEKQCTGICGRTLPAIREYFASNGKGGLQSQCKECKRKKAKERYTNPEVHERILAREKARRNRPEIRERRLAQAKAYYRQPGMRERKEAQRKARYGQNGTHGQTRQRTYHEQPEARERRLAQQRDYYMRPEVREQKRVYAKARRSCPEIRQRMIERAREYKKRPEIQERRRVYGEAYNSRPDVRERRKAYYQVYNHTYYNRPDVRVRSQAYGNRQRARKRALGTYTPVQIQEKLKAQKHKCYYCSVKFNKKKDGKYIYHIDHTFPLSRVVGTDIPANSIDYLVLACPSCNMSKRNKYPWEWPQGGRLL